MFGSDFPELRDTTIYLQHMLFPMHLGILGGTI